MASPAADFAHSPSVLRTAHRTPGLSRDESRTLAAVVRGIDGRRYLTDELNHQLIIEDLDGSRVHIGHAGSGAGELLYPRGLALLTAFPSGQTRLYVCDAGNHRIQVFDEDGLPLGAFGGYGTRPGQFNTPTDIVFVHPDCPGEPCEESGPEGRMLAVADRQNHRVQLFDTEGVFLASVGAQRWAIDGTRARLSRTAWPYFRVGSEPVLPLPTWLAWHAPLLEIGCGDGSTAWVDLGAALLPDFRTWRPGVSPAQASVVAATLLARPERTALPAPVVMWLEQALAPLQGAA